MATGGSQNMIVDVVFDEPGVYAAVNHDYVIIVVQQQFRCRSPLDPVNESSNRTWRCLCSRCRFICGKF